MGMLYLFYILILLLVGLGDRIKDFNKLRFGIFWNCWMIRLLDFVKMGIVFKDVVIVKGVVILIGVEVNFVMLLIILIKEVIGLLLNNF